jgi:hypothetical protein
MRKCILPETSHENKFLAWLAPLLEKQLILARLRDPGIQPLAWQELRGLTSRCDRARHSTEAKHPDVLRSRHQDLEHAHTRSRHPFKTSN